VPPNFLFTVLDYFFQLKAENLKKLTLKLEKTCHIFFDYLHQIPVLCSIPAGLAIRGFANHIHIFLERNPREYRGKPVLYIDFVY